MANIRSLAKSWVTKLISVISRLGVTPNQLTAAGLIISLSAIPFIIAGNLFAAGWIFTIGSLCDALDGSLARHNNAQTRLGGFMDSLFDRISEAGVYIALGVYFAMSANLLGVVLTNIVFIGSMLTSYIRAIAEAKGIDCKVGICTRLERMILICTALILNILLPVLFVLAIGTLVTVLQRFLHVRESLLKQ